MGNFVTYLVTYSGDKLPPHYIGSTTEIKATSNKYFGTICSKKYKETFKKELKDHKELFSITILSNHDTRQEAYDEELRLHKEFDVVKSPNYMNESYAQINGYFGRTLRGSDSPKYGMSNYEIWLKRGGKEYADEKQRLCVEKMSIANSGKNNAMYGIPGLSGVNSPRYGISNYEIWLKRGGKDYADKKAAEYTRKQSIVNGGENNPMYGRKNEVIAINENGVKVRVSKEEFEKNDKLSGHTIGMVTVREISTNMLVNITKKEYAKNKDKYTHSNKGNKASVETKQLLSNQRKGLICVKDWNGKHFRVKKDDERFKTGEIANNSAVRWLIIDNNGIEHKVMDIEKFLLLYGILYHDNFKFIDGEMITNHKPRKSKSLNGWIFKRIDKKKKYGNKN